MTNNVLFAAAAPDGFPSTTMTPDATSVPDYAILCEIDFKVENNRLIFFYKNIGTFAITAADPIGAAVQRIAASAWRPPNFGPRAPQRRRSSLSLNNKKRAYIIIILEATKAWQFSREAPCFTLFQDPNVDLKEYYSDPTAIDPQGNPVGPIAGSSGARVAYFVAEGEKSNAEQPNQVNADRFNIHVDFNEDAQAYIPIVIDPDVGHPGGTQP